MRKIFLAASAAIAVSVAVPAAGWTIALTDSYRSLFILRGVVTLAALLPLARLASGSGAEPSFLMNNRTLPPFISLNSRS